MSDTKPAGWYAAGPRKLTYWDGTANVFTTSTREFSRHLTRGTQVSGVDFAAPVHERPPRRFPWSIVAAAAVGVGAIVWVGMQLGADRSHPYEAEIRQALSDHSVRIESITGGRTAVIRTDLSALNELDVGAALGICRFLEAETWPEDLRLAEVRSVGGHRMVTCVLADYD